MQEGKEILRDSVSPKMRKSITPAQKRMTKVPFARVGGVLDVWGFRPRARPPARQFASKASEEVRSRSLFSGTARYRFVDPCPVVHVSSCRLRINRVVQQTALTETGNE
jgi:hypothetical protein